MLITLLTHILWLHCTANTKIFKSENRRRFHSCMAYKCITRTLFKCATTFRTCEGHLASVTICLASKHMLWVHCIVPLVVSTVSVEEVACSTKFRNDLYIIYKQNCYSYLDIYMYVGAQWLCIGSFIDCRVASDAMTRLVVKERKNTLLFYLHIVQLNKKCKVKFMNYILPNLSLCGQTKQIL